MNKRLEWALYGCVLILVLILVYLQSLGGAKRTEVESSERIGVDSLLMARYAVGTRELLGAAAQASNLALIKGLDDKAMSSADRVRVAMLRGELIGAEDALEALSQMPDDEDVAALKMLYSEGLLSLSPAQRDGLVARHAWVGKLALSHGPDADPSIRAAVLAAALRTAVVLMGFMGLLSVMLLIGSGLLVFGLTAQAQGRLTLHYPRLAQAQRPGNTAFLEALVLLLATMPLTGLLMGLLPLGLAPLVQALPLLLIYWIRYRSGPELNLPLALGWYRGKGLLRELGSGLVGYVAGLPVLALGLGLTLVLSHFAGTQPTHPITEMFGDFSAPRLIVLFTLACVGAPLVEETLFRGAFFHHLRARTGFVLAGLIQGVIFAAVHPQGWVAIPVLASIGFVLAGIREWRGSLIASMTAHGLNNSTALCLTVFLLS